MHRWARNQASGWSALVKMARADYERPASPLKRKPSFAFLPSAPSRGCWGPWVCGCRCSRCWRRCGNVDFSSLQGFMQRPGHQSDIWYIGIYSPATALGNFVLTGTQLTGPTVSFDGPGSTIADFKKTHEATGCTTPTEFFSFTPYI